MLVLEHNKSLIDSETSTLELELISGTVIEDQGRITETHVSGGGGSTGNNGYISPVSSMNVTTHTFWIREESGKETLISIEKKSLPIKTGHKITLLRSKGRWVYYINHTSTDIGTLCDLSHLKSSAKTYQWFDISVSIAGVLIGMSIGETWIAAIPGFFIVYTAAILIIVKKRTQEVRKKLPAILKEFAQKIDDEKKGKYEAVDKSV